jgi:hypothetical protein
MNARTTSPAGSTHRVVIVGCGFAGLFAARALKRAPVEVTVIDRTNHHLFQPLLYQMATGILSEGDIAPAISDVLRNQHNATVMVGDVVAVDAARRVLAVDTLGSRSEVVYDSLIVDTGSTQSYFGHDEFADHVPGLKTIDDALEIRGRIFGAFELAEHEGDPTARRGWMIVIVGAGPTGVEMAGQIAELAHRSLQGNFRLINPADARVVLLDGGPRLLGAISNGFEWSPDGTYYNGTPTGRTTVFDYDGELGLTGPRTFAEIPAGAGVPDGLTVDDEGGVWIALYGGGTVLLYTAEGRLDAAVGVPARKVTACTFGGSRLDERFITTSQEELEPGRDPLAGALFKVMVGVRGLPAREFAG